MIDAVKMFPKVEKMLYDLAWKASRRTGIPFEDTKSETFVKFMEVCRTYDRKKGSKFSTWLHRKVKFHLMDLNRSRARDRLTFVDEVKDEMFPRQTWRAPSSIMDRLSHLSPEAQRLVENMLSRTEDDPKEIMREACRDLAFEYGCDPVYTRIVLHEIKAEISQR